jgi:dihydropteroate synthase-like protein
MHIHFVTGRLAEHALRAVVQPLAAELGFEFSIDVLPITVAALMTPQWIAKRIRVPAQATQVLLPGYCDGDLSILRAATSVPIDLGPRDLRALPEFFGRSSVERVGYGAYSIEILAEINDAPRLDRDEILRQARAFRADGADVIDVGCHPGEAWSGVADCVRALRDEGFRVSIDSLDPSEIALAVRAGAELVLSVNSSNREAAKDWGCEVVVIPDDCETLAGFEETIELLSEASVPLRIDPVLEPIGCGLAASLGRYIQVRQRYVDAEMMMGIGNLTELTDADSAPINVLLLGICEELKIHSVLTTQEINWARSSVRKCDLARRLVHYAVRHQTIPKHLEPALVMLRDPRVYAHGAETLERLTRELKDHNYRIFAEGGELHLITAGLHLHGTNAFVLCRGLLEKAAGNLSPSHAFYLGYELAKATTALTLGKQYRQDEALDWGFLTRLEDHR